MSKRQIKKRILAEALKLYRETELPVQRFTMRATGDTFDRIVHRELRHPYSMLDGLINACAQLEGDQP